MPCSLCHQVGHNKRTCPSRAPVQPAPVQPSVPVQPAPVQQRNPPHRFNYSGEQLQAAYTTLFGRATTPPRRRPRYLGDLLPQVVAGQDPYFLVWGEHRPNNAPPFNPNRLMPFPVRPVPRPRRLGTAVEALAVEPTEPKVLKREPLPKHISVAVFGNLAEEDKHCQICLGDLTEDTLQLSVCGHNFCAGCYKDPRIVNCGVCRKTL